MSTTSPNMGLTIPTVSQTAGPTYAAEINSSLTSVDSHNHSTGQGVQIPPGGININSDLTFGGNNATNVQTIRFTALASPLSAANPNLVCAYTAGVDLYYNDGNGNQIRMTQSGAIAGTPGSIASLASPATATYVLASTKFVWQSDANVAAIMDFRSAIFRTAAASSNGITVSAPATIPANYSLTLPTVGSATSFMSIDTSGNMAPSVAVSLGIATANIASGAVTRAKQASVGQQVSSDSGSFSTTNTSATDVTNLSVSITTTGRPVMVMLMATSGLGTITAEQTLGGGQTSVGCTIHLLRDGADISAATSRVQTSSGVANQITVPPSSVSYLDVVAAGSYTYKVQANATTSGLTVTVQNCVLAVWEL